MNDFSSDIYRSCSSSFVVNRRLYIIENDKINVC